MLATFALSAVTGFSSPLPFAAVVFLCLVYAAAIQADSAALTAGAVASSPVGHRGATLAVHSTLGFGGSLFAPALVGVVLDRAAPLGAATAWGFAFLAMGSMALLGYVFFMVQRRRLASGPPPDREPSGPSVIRACRDRRDEVSQRIVDFALKRRRAGSRQPCGRSPRRAEGVALAGSAPWRGDSACGTSSPVGG